MKDSAEVKKGSGSGTGGKTVTKASSGREGVGSGVGGTGCRGGGRGENDAGVQWTSAEAGIGVGISGLGDKNPKDIWGHDEPSQQ